MPQEVTYHVKFIAECYDSAGYSNYVFENLEYTDIDYKYIMCVRFPNWDQEYFKIGDVGYLNVRYVQGGIDKWFDGTSFNFYKYTNIIFLKFIQEQPVVKLNDITIT